MGAWKDFWENLLGTEPNLTRTSEDGIAIVGTSEAYLTHVEQGLKFLKNSKDPRGYAVVKAHLRKIQELPASQPSYMGRTETPPTFYLNLRDAYLLPTGHTEREEQWALQWCTSHILLAASCAQMCHETRPWSDRDAVHPCCEQQIAMCRAIGTPNSMLRYVAKKVGHDLMPTGRVRRVQGIEIWGGTDAFLNQVEEALNRLQEHSASRGYSTVTGYIDRIEEDDTGGMLPDLKVRTMALSPVTAFANNSENLRALQWCASAIAHDAYHSMLYHSGQPYTGTEAELQCNAFQMEVCQDLGAPADMIEYVRQQDGRHHELPIYH